MSSQKIEKSTRNFWLSTCGVDTHRRSAMHARHDTPWNAFSKDNVLVCTLWLDQIVDVFDPDEGRVRRFVKIGGKRKTWKGPAVAHGEEADKNLRKADKERLRVVGYEAEPDSSALARGERKVAHFYMNRAHELSRIFEFSSKKMLDKLGVERAFELLTQENHTDAILPGYMFELVEPKGDFPGQSSVGESTEESFLGSEEGEFNADSNEENLTTEEQAIRSIPILIGHVLQQIDGVLEPITYKQLAE